MQKMTHLCIHREAVDWPREHFKLWKEVLNSTKKTLVNHWLLILIKFCSEIEILRMLQVTLLPNYCLEKTWDTLLLDFMIFVKRCCINPFQTMSWKNRPSLSGKDETRLSFMTKTEQFCLVTGTNRIATILRRSESRIAAETLGMLIFLIQSPRRLKTPIAWAEEHTAVTNERPKDYEPKPRSIKQH